MKSSLLISLALHGLVVVALFLEWHGVTRAHFPERIYSIRLVGAIGSMRSGAKPKQDAVKVTAAKEVAKKKAPRKEEPKVAVPKKPAKSRKAKETSKVKSNGKGKVEDAKAAPAEQPAEASAGAGTEGAGNGTGMSVDAARFPFSYYLSAIEQRVSESWYSAVSHGKSGLTCVIYFRLMRTGKVEDVRVEKSSGNDYFDRGAQRAVLSGAPYPPLPRGFPDEFLGIHFTFVQKE